EAGVGAVLVLLLPLAEIALRGDERLVSVVGPAESRLSRPIVLVVLTAMDSECLRPAFGPGAVVSLVGIVRIILHIAAFAVVTRTAVEASKIGFLVGVAVGHVEQLDQALDLVLDRVAAERHGTAAPCRQRSANWRKVQICRFQIGKLHMCSFWGLH